MMTLRIGYGEDAHALAAGRLLVIGGVTVTHSPRGALAHSDGDVLLHATADALLSAFALGDIGTYFPPSSPTFKDMDSTEILRAVRDLIIAKVATVRLHNLAAVVTLDTPKLGTLREAIAARLAELLAMPVGDVGITFKTSEGLAPDHIQAAVTLLLSVEK